ncbi:MAG: hypothetical protein WD578_08530 [Bacteroidales bacterium]
MQQKFNISIWLAFFLSFCITTLSKAQGEVLAIPENSGEEIGLFSDRSIYLVSEDLYFSAYCKESPGNNSREWSTVLYVELIRWDGTKVTQSKIPLSNGSANSFIRIPGGINSGNYYLRAYTMWMRNYSPYGYSYLPVKIINPKIAAIEPGPGNNEEPAFPVVSDIVQKLDGVVVSDLRETYGKRTLVDVGIQLPDELIPERTSVAVVPVGSLDVQHSQLKFTQHAAEPISGEIEFYPEINGLTLTGKLMDAASGKPVPDAGMNLSSYSSAFYFSAVKSARDGTFSFTLPRETGEHELHIAAEGDGSDSYEILIASEFCNKPVTLPYVPFNLNHQERAMAKTAWLNVQLAAKYHEEAPSASAMQVPAYPFYGSPATVTYTEEFIELIDLREFFFELVYHVSIGYENRNPYLFINGQGSSQFYPPLLLLDNIPVANDEQLLKIPSRRIDRIEVVSRGYVVGKNKYSGIISIYSNKKDMAGLETGEANDFFNFRFYDLHDGSTPGFLHPGVDSNIPDMRNLLHWQPGLADTDRVRFYTGDAKGAYQIVIRGVDKQGRNSVYMTGKFSVAIPPDTGSISTNGAN